jgi:hypothetical protein
MYGPGIYMAVDSTTSFGYCGTPSSGCGWPLTTLGRTVHALALCEVINDVPPPNPYYVVPEEHKVTTRFIFLFSEKQGKPHLVAQAIAKKLPSFQL